MVSEDSAAQWDYESQEEQRNSHQLWSAQSLWLVMLRLSESVPLAMLLYFQTDLSG